MKLPLFILCLCVPFYVASALNSDGLTLLSLLNHWTSVLASLSSSWMPSDSTPCSWLGVLCDHYRNVVSLNLTASRIRGQLGPEIGQLNYLHTLVLSRNGFSGTIPQELGNCSLLKYIDLSENYFSGHIPFNLERLQNLRHMSLSSNQLTGEIPESLFQIPRLQELYLYNNSLSGAIPSIVGNATELLKLHLSRNQLSGIIPSSMGNCSKLEALFLEDNRLKGNLPQSLTNLKNLTYLYVSKNNISGAIPSSLGYCTSLTGLILSMNNITGLIPSEVGNLVNLQALNLSHNNLEGPLPQQLSYCTKMETFDVGFNFLNGSFPSSLRSWTGLTTLILRENHFSGIIPFMFSEYGQLLELQLGGNMFEGSIPESIGALQNLLYGLNLSANKLTGKIPSDIRALQKLQSLDLSLNNLTGSINHLNELFSLVEVNISYNSLVGPLPKWLMRHLNLSPTSFLGNPGLCVSCPSSDGSNCTKTSLLKACDSESTNHKANKHLILFIVFGFSLLVVGMLGIILFYIHHSGQRSKEEVIADYEEQVPWSLNDGNLRIIDVMKVTNDLNDQYIIGRGGHGIVYKAELDFGVFAVKKIEFAGNNRKRISVQREIEISRKIRHQNVARCLGYFIEKDYGLSINKYMENGSLDDVLHENNPLRCLAWNVRYKIAIGIAKGLAYLHHCCDPPIFHRDIKPKNILLDSDMQPHITDFGISIVLNQSSTLMHLRSTYNIGTRGFMAPEIAYVIVPSCEIDVYSYGVVLLELVTRKRVLDPSFEEKGTTLVGWFKSIWRETRELEEIVDSSLARELSDLDVVVQVIKVVLVALICTETDPGKRLKMGDIVEFFETCTDPGIFVQHNRASFHLGSSLATAATSIILQDEVMIPPNRGPFSIIHKVIKATSNLENLYIIGRGIHGVVYKAQLYGPVYALKKLAFTGNKGKISGMVREIQILDRIRHQNIVKLLDFLFKKDYGLFLYSHMPNGNLHDVLLVKNPPPLWHFRYKIAVGIAHGLAYLHYNCDPAIVHCAIKPKNILLDIDMEPHIADFGIAKLLDQASSSSTPSSSVPGTVWCITPENAYSTANTREFDVYSYGVVLLQLITRKKAFDPSSMEGIDIVGWVRTLWWETGTIDKIVDSSLAKECLISNVQVQVIKVLLMALKCTDNDPHMRPTMIDVINQF